MPTRAAFIGLGSNLGDPEQQIRNALSKVEAFPRTQIKAISRFYRSAPMGPMDQPDYCNAACALETELEPSALLQALIEVERAAGRQRGPQRWGPRLIDLDLLHVDGRALDEPGLTLPHPGIAQRNFVLLPLSEVAPQLQIPGVGNVADAAEKIGRVGLSAWFDAG